MAMMPNALATELARIMAANTGQSQRIMKLKMRLRRKGLPPSVTELVRKSKKSRNYMPMIFTPASGP